MSIVTHCKVHRVDRHRQYVHRNCDVTLGRCCSLCLITLLLYALFRGLSARTGAVINIQPQNIGGIPSPYGRTCPLDHQQQSPAPIHKILSIKNSEPPSPIYSLLKCRVIVCTVLPSQGLCRVIVYTVLPSQGLCRVIVYTVLLSQGLCRVIVCTVLPSQGLCSHCVHCAAVTRLV
jgi:hypothetical protein